MIDLKKKSTKSSAQALKRHCKHLNRLRTSCTLLARANADPDWKSASSAVLTQKSMRGLYRRGSRSLSTYSIEMSQHLPVSFPRAGQTDRSAHFVVSCRILPNNSGNFGVSQSQNAFLSLPGSSSVPLSNPEMNSNMARILCRSYTLLLSISAR